MWDRFHICGQMTDLLLFVKMLLCGLSAYLGLDIQAVCVYFRGFVLELFADFDFVMTLKETFHLWVTVILDRASRHHQNDPLLI
jgi:hypothetical protein